MSQSYPQVLSALLELMSDLAGDWEYDGRIGAETRLFGDLELESLDLVVLGMAIQERYGAMPFAEFFAAVGERPEQDVSVGELAAFAHEHATRAVGAAVNGAANGAGN